MSMRTARLGMTSYPVSVGENITDYGASTSSADNSAAVIAAVAAAVASGSYIVVVDPGTYVCNSAINLPENIKLIGYGPTVSILKIADSATGLFSIAKTDLSTNAQNAHQAASTFPVKCFLYTTTNAASSGKKSGIVIANLGIDGNGANQADSGSYANICINNTNQALIENVNSYNARPDLTTSGNNRAYCLLLCDDYMTTVNGGYYYGSGYDNIGGRAYSVGARLNSVWCGATSGTGSRASCQFAYQCCDFSCDDCWFENTATATSPVGFINHACQRGVLSNCVIRSTNGTAVSIFGDNTDGTDDTNFDQINDYPSATLDEYGESMRVIGCEIENSANVSVVNIDIRFSRVVTMMANIIRHTATGSAVCLQASGATSAYVGDVNNTITNGERRHRFIGNQFIQQSGSNIIACTFVRNAVFSGNTFSKSSSSNNGIQFLACVDCDIVDNTIHVAATGALNIGIYLDLSGGNACSGLRIIGNRFIVMSSSLNNGIYVNNSTAATNIRVSGNDFTNCTNKITFSTGSAGTGWWVSENRSPVTEAVGTATVGGGGTIDITHGLTSWRTLRVGDLLITPTSATGVGTLYVSAVSSTIFTVTGTAAATFSWQARANAA